MSGICGWLEAGAIVADDAAARALLTRMAAPLSRYDHSPLHTRRDDGAAVAIAAQPGGVHLHRADGVLVALWGRPTLHGSDAGVAPALAALWLKRGNQACAELSGPFALCILDPRRGQALLALDRSGTQSMIYQQSAQGLLFASSSDALLAHPAGAREWDPQSIYNYLYFHMVPAPATIYRGQQRLLPGEYLHFRAGKAVRGKYWEMQFHERDAPPFSELKSQFIDILHRSVRETLGQHRVGAFLSGGTDSSTLAGVLSTVGGAPARVYSIGFDAPGYDEMEYARIAAHHFGAEHHERYVTADDVVAAVPRIAAVFDQPFGNASAVPTFYCAQMAHDDGVTRMLGGDGGDELFGGNQRYARQAVFARYERLPSALRQTVLEPFLFKLAGGRQQRLLRKARSYIEQALLPMPARLETYNLLQRYGHEQVLDADFLASVDPGAPLASLNEAYWLTHGLSQINQMLALDLKFTLADNDLPKVNKACELAGVEAAFPFLSDAMLAFSSRLAPHQKLNGTRLRYFFKQALRGTLPRAIIHKKKHGFGLPVGLWLQQHAGLRSLAFDSLHELKARRIVRAGFIDALMDRHLAEHPAYHGTMVWVLMMLEQWCRQHHDSQGYSDRPASDEDHDELEIRQG